MALPRNVRAGGRNPGVDASAARKPGCRPAGSKTVVEGPHARIFRWQTVVWGCLFERGVAVRLTSNDGYGQDFLRAPKPRVNGRFVAYTYYWEGAESGYGYAVRVTNLRTGRTNLEDFEAVEKGRPSKVVVNALTVTADGWLAWGWTLTYEDGRVVPEIRRLKPGDDDIGLELKPLDSGPGRRSSLADANWAHHPVRSRRRAALV